MIEIAVASPAPPTLNAIERDRLRYQLENLFNEQDLMIRNQKVDHSDVEHQRREFKALKVFERIPFEVDAAGLKKSLNESATEQGLLLTFFKLLPRPKRTPPSLPTLIYSDELATRLNDEHLVELIPFLAILRGSKASVRAWTRSWPVDQLRLAEFERMREVSLNRWEVRAHAFRFQNLKLPIIQARDPLLLLPPWALKKPEAFAQSEPMLWSFVRRTREIATQAKPLYRNRANLILNSKRMSFFLSKAVPRSP